jgi:hypothetical protein
VRLSAELDLPFRFVGRLTAAFDEADYLLPVAVPDAPDTPVERLDRLNSYGGALLRRITDSFRIGGTATYQTRTSNLPGNSYDRWVYGVTADLTLAP